MSPARIGPRRDLVVCTQLALGWTASHVRSDRQDAVALYTLRFRDTVGATVRNRRDGVVDVWIGGRCDAVLPRYRGGGRRTAGARRGGGTVAVTDAVRDAPLRWR